MLSPKLEQNPYDKFCHIGARFRHTMASSDIRALDALLNFHTRRLIVESPSADERTSFSYHCSVAPYDPAQ